MTSPSPDYVIGTCLLVITRAMSTRINVVNKFLFPHCKHTSFITGVMTTPDTDSCFTLVEATGLSFMITQKLIALPVVMVVSTLIMKGMIGSITNGRKGMTN